MNSKKKLLNNTAIYFIGNFATKILVFFMLPLYTQYLKPSDYGTFDTIQGLTTLMVPIVFVQISDAVIRFLLDAKKAKEKTLYISNTFAVVFIGTVVSIILIPLVAKEKGFPYLLLLYLYFTLHAWHVVLQQMVRSLGYNKLYAAGGVVSTLTTVGLNLLFILQFNMKASALIVSSIITSVIMCLIMFFVGKLYSYIKFSAIKLKTIKEMLRYCIPLIPNTLSWQMITTFSRLYLGHAGGQDLQGLYAVANRFPTLISMVTGIFYLSWQEVGILVFNTDEKNKTYTEICNYYLRCLFAGVIVMLPVSRFYIQYGLSSDYRSIWIYIPVMLVTAAISAVNSFLGTAYLGGKKTKNVLMTSLIAAAINVALVLALTGRMKIWGVIIGGFVSFSVLFLIRSYDVRRLVTIRFNARMILLGAAALGLTVAGYYQTSGVAVQLIWAVISCLLGLILVWPIITSICKALVKKGGRPRDD